MTGKRPCRYFSTPAGCRAGSNCPFAHIKSNGSSSRGQASPSHARGQNKQTPFLPNLPRGACRDFWVDGSCSRGFSCKYEHKNGPGSSSTNKIETPATTISSLAVNQSSGSDNWKTPGDVQTSLKVYIAQSFSGFRSSTQAYHFLECLNNARPLNSSWKPVDGQNLLEALVNPPNGLLRLAECIKRPSEPGNMAGWSFIRGTLPVLEYMSSEWVTKSTITHNVSALYGILHHNFQALQSTIEAFMPQMMSARAFRDAATPTKTISGLDLFAPMFITLFEYTCRYKTAMETNLGMKALIEQLARWFYEWESAVESAASFEDPCRELTPPTRRFRISELRKKVEPLLNVINRTHVVVNQSVDPQREVQQDIAIYRQEATLARLHREFQGPGNLRAEGPRHDNDKVDIQEIRIAPTQDELLCRLPPYLPANIPGAPHHHQPEGVPRLLDIQFRLLREELVAPIRTAIQLLSDDLAQPKHVKTQLSDIMKAKGGRYRGQADSGQDSVIFSVFTNVTFGPFTVDRRGCSIGIFMDTPPGSDARHKDAKHRAAYWETASKKRLMQGGLVALLLKDASKQLEIFVGLISSNTNDIKESAASNSARIGIRVSFFDAEIELRVARQLQENSRPQGNQIRLLLEAPVMYEGIRPFLSALQVEPERLPFADYLRHHIDSGYLSQLPVTPPQYAREPGFSFELKAVLRRDSNIDSLRLDANSPDSVTHARAELIKSSILDKSQAEAVVDVLTREISLIQGPPGTGKSYTGVEIIKILVQNNVTPIVLMAFTNHALDHMLISVLNGATKNIARLGSRSSDERISQFSLDSLTRDSSEHKGIIGRKYGAMKDIEEEMNKLMNAIVKKHVPRQNMNETVLLDYPEHYDNIFVSPPSWIAALYAEHTVEETGWNIKNKKKDNKPSKLEFWRDSRDLEWLSIPSATSKKSTSANVNAFAKLDGTEGGPKETNHQRQVEERRAEQLLFLRKHGISSIPAIPATNRPLDALKNDDRIWSMSAQERKKLFQLWKIAALERMGDSRLADFVRLRKEHAQARQEYQDTQDQVQVNLLKNISVIGCTTTGAAKLVSLFASIEPRVMIVEEAGQVLEAHVLAALVPSISQVIMIGDPLQLRPNLVNYKLSVDNHDTGKVYRFDRSLMERLSDSGLHMSRLDEQRRMRPEISNLIRNTLYKGLIDNPRVKDYPSVRGMNHNMYFLSHCHKESGGGEDSVSKYNQYEVDMIYGLVKHLLRQGCYGTSSDSGSIVVLSAYLGQVPKINAKFRGEITTVVDERDIDQLAERGLEADITTVEQVELSKRILVRTLDNFQGEEGDIIILSLARNAGSAFVKDVTSLEHDKSVRSSVGFLKSINRTNVGLSRAKQGLYILGNAPELAVASKMWSTVLQELDSKNLIGSGFPIACSRHPDYVRTIDHPDMFAVHAPDGGCLQSCSSRLPCGHTCPYKCHSDDPNHVAIKCPARCPRLCPQQHPCRKLCYQDCGECRFPVPNIVLPCDHVLENATCHDSRHPNEVLCRSPVEKKLPYCEHKETMPCHQDPSTWKCHLPCSGPLRCCGRPCTSNCDDCMKRTSPVAPREERPIGEVVRLAHPGHKCGKDLRCGHRCADVCAEGHVCSGKCKEPCSQACSHHRCAKRCCDPCVPCMESCAWECPHQRCPLTCGAPCSRLPCDEPCRKLLKCGHPCLSICGEPCDIQVCRSCAPEHHLNSSVDLYLGLTLKELGTGDNLDERTITLACRHTFTVETLDGVTELNKFYAQNSKSEWASATLPDLSGEMRPRPVCPTCRAPVTSRRYGRVFKRADLDVLEHNVASTMSSELFAAQEKLQESRSGVEATIVSGIKSAVAMNSAQSAMPNKKQKETAEKERAIILNKSGDGPTNPEFLSESLSKVHFIHPKQQAAWNDSIASILGAYTKAFQLFDKRSSHYIAYEGSLSALYRDELEKSLASLKVLPMNPEHLAMRLARTRIGDTPPPRTDKRFLVEAFWIIIEILLLLSRMAHRCSELLSDRPNDKKLWFDFAYFLLGQAQVDARKALEMAQASESHRKVVSCNLLMLRAEIDIARYRLKEKIVLQEMTPGRKAELESEHARTGEMFKRRVRQVEHAYRSQFNNTEQREADMWLRANFGTHTDALLRTWDEAKKSIHFGTWYTTVTDEEKLSIVKAFGFYHAGHFYRCPNGHPYVITECGGAMQESRCPECRAPIGGGSHRLRSDNTQDREFVALARGQGSATNPW